MSRRADDPILSYRGAGVALAKLRRRPWWMVIVGAAGIVFLLYPFTTFWVSNTDVCWACGATRVHGKTFWIVPTSSSLLETSMSAWLGAHGGHVHTWRFWFGSSSTYRCALGTSPPIR